MPACPHCKAENIEGARFCMVCGQPMGDDSPLGDLLDAGIVCPSCDTYNETNRKTCVGCGQSLSGLTGFLQAVPSEVDPFHSEITAVEPHASALPRTTPEVPAAARPRQSPPPLPPSDEPITLTGKKASTGQMPAATGQPMPSGTCPFCQARLPIGAQACLVCGRRLVPAKVAPVAATDVSIRLRLVRGFGREDSTFPVGPAGVTVGRSGALINIPEDPFLSPLHLRLRLEAGRLLLEDLGSHNGSFVRVRAQADIKQGAEFLAGAQRLILLGLGGPTTDVRTPASADTRAYGGPLPRQLFVALRQLHSGRDGRGRAGAVLLRTGPVVSLGARGCDINFPDDPLLAARHLELHVRATGVQLVDVGAGSGVFLRIQGSAPLQNGDEILAGDEVFRVEMG